MNLHAWVQDKPLLGQRISWAGTNCSWKAPCSYHPQMAVPYYCMCYLVSPLNLWLLIALRFLRSLRMISLHLIHPVRDKKNSVANQAITYCYYCT